MAKQVLKLNLPQFAFSIVFFFVLFHSVISDEASKTFIFRVDSQSKPSVFPTHYHWYTSEFAQQTHILHVYNTVFHGFSALLTPQQVASISQHPSILAVFEDRRRQLHTTRSPQFLGLRNQRGLWSESDYGSDVIVGVFDTGVWPEHRSFSDLNLGPIPRRWKGACETGLSGVSLYSGAALSGKMYQLVYPGKSGVLGDSLCMENSLDSNLVKGKIVVCDRGSSPRVAKGLVVKKAGGVGMILANGISNGEGLVGDAHLLPACAVGSSEGDAIKKYISTSANPTATIDFKGTILGIKPAPVIASFSARGPNGLNPQILKPDLIAPGVNIIAAWTDAVGPTGLDSDTRRTEFNILSGTSMACPHVSGAAALLKSAHPDWSPAVIRSAMMTTATVLDNRNQVMTDEATGNSSTPYDFGAGHLNLGRAMDPGLVYDLTNNDYVNFLCSIGYGPRVIQVITRAPASCPARKPSPTNFNYPSFVAMFPVSSKGVASMTFIRTVTNVGSANSVYRVSVEAPARGVTVTVKPLRLVFSEAVKKQSYVVTVVGDTRNMKMGQSGAVFGSLTWTDGKHVVRSPIVVTQMEPL
ncbi:hypothetical protein ACSQ67_022225 [Phaseolus vulgaris]